MVLSFAAGSVLEHVELDNIVCAAGGDGVIADPGTSLAVTERATPIMGVQVASGYCVVSLTLHDRSSAYNLSIDASHATLYRKDLITYDPTTGVPVVTKGTNHAGGAADPIYPPDIPTGDILLAIVNVDAAATIIEDSDIDDMRIFVVLDQWDIIGVSGLLDSDLPEESTTSSTYVKAKEFTIPSNICYNTIELYLTWEMKHSNTTGSSESKIYRNGVAVGVEKTRNTTSYATFTDTLSGWSAGDKVQLYFKTSAGYTCYVDYFEVHGAYVKPW